MRYYQYISDSKVDMLLPQIPLSFKQQIAGEMGIDIGVFSAKLSTTLNTLENRISRMEAVEKHILNRETVGSPENPDSWINGQGTATIFFLAPYNEAVFYLMCTSTNLVGLGGSAIHVIGNSPNVSQGSPYSFYPSIVDSMIRVSEQFFTLPDNDISRLSSPAVHGRSPWSEVIHDLCETARSENLPKQQISYLARRLVTDENFGHGLQITLATPIYVAAAE